MSSPSEMQVRFRKELELCGVREGEGVAVLSEGGELDEYRHAFLAAAKDLGAEAEDVHLESAEALDANDRLKQIGQNALSRSVEAMSTLKSVGMVVDLMVLLFSKEQIEIQECGTRMLLAVEPFEILKRLFPDENLRERVEAGERRLSAAEQLRFVNGVGTDVTYKLEGRSILTEYGFTDSPGRWDHWPSGFLATVAKPGGVSGRVVMDRGDILLPQKKQLSKPVEFVIREGMVREIRGGTEAQELRTLMESYRDPRAYAVSHIGWGLNSIAQWTADLPGIGMDSRAYYGNVLFSLGPDTEFGGTNDTACHLDLPMRGCSLFLDDEVIVEKGEVVPPDMKAERL